MDPVTTTHWVHDLSPFFFRFGESFGLRYYGLAYLLGFLGGGWLLHRYAITGRTTLRSEVISDLLFGLVAGVYIGGRVGYFLLYAPADLLAHPLLLFKVWEGGMASHGGFAGVAGALAWFARRHHISFFHLSDLVASVTALGLLLGRLANFINGELWGKVSTVPWAVIFPASERPGTPLDLIAPATPPNFTPPPSKVPSFSLMPSGASGAPPSSAPTLAASPASSSSATPSCASSPRFSANPIPA